MATKRLVSFRSEYAAMLAPFICEDETRYHLHGIGVFPHPTKGVLLVTTNGHCMGVVHDEEGQTNGKWICPLTPNLLTAMTPQMRPAYDEDGGEYEYDARDKKPSWLTFVNDVAHLTTGACPDIKKLPAIGPAHVAVDYIPAIDGTYPDWRRVIPENATNPMAVPFDGSYLSDFYTVAQVRKAKTIMLFNGEKDGPAIIRVPSIPEFMGILMPVKDTMPGRLPDWLPPPSKSKAA